MCLAIPGKLLDIAIDDGLFRRGRIDFGGIVKEISLACVPAAVVGDYLLIHAGMAISIVDAAEAARVFELIQSLDEEIGDEISQ